MEPMPPAVEAWSPNHWTPGNSHDFFFLTALFRINEHTIQAHLDEMSGISKFFSKCICVFLCLNELRENKQWLLKDTWLFIEVIKYSIVMMVVQFCEYTQNHWIVHFKQVISMVCELYFSLFPLEGIVWSCYTWMREIKTSSCICIPVNSTHIISRWAQKRTETVKT